MCVYLTSQPPPCAGIIDHVLFDLAGKKLQVVFTSLAAANATAWDYTKIRLQVRAWPLPFAMFLLLLFLLQLFHLISLFFFALNFCPPSPPPCDLTPIGSMQVDKTSAARPGTNFVVDGPDGKAPLVRGAFEAAPAAAGAETTITVTWS